MLGLAIKFSTLQDFNFAHPSLAKGVVAKKKAIQVVESRGWSRSRPLGFKHPSFIAAWSSMFITPHWQI